MFKGTDHVGTFMIFLSSPVVICVQNFRVSIFYFSYREFHEFRTKTINGNDIFSIDEKTRV